MASCLYSGGATASAGNGARIEAPSRTDTNFLKRVIGILLFLVDGFLGAAADKKGPLRFFTERAEARGLQFEPEADAVHTAEIVVEIAIGLGISGNIVAAGTIADQNRSGIEDVLDREV